MEHLLGWLFLMLNLLKNHSYQELLKNLCQLDNLIQVVLSQNESFRFFFYKNELHNNIQFLLETFQNRNSKKVLFSLEGIWKLQSRTFFANFKNNLSSKFGWIDKKAKNSYLQQTVQKLRLWLVIILMMESYFSFHTLRIQICGMFFKKTLMT